MKRFWKLADQRSIEKKQTWIKRNSDSLMLFITFITSIAGLYFSIQANNHTISSFNHQLAIEKTDSLRKKYLDSINRRKDSLYLVALQKQNDILSEELNEQRKNFKRADLAQQVSLSLGKLIFKSAKKDSNIGLLTVKLENKGQRPAEVLKVLMFYYNRHLNSSFIIDAQMAPFHIPSDGGFADLHSLYDTQFLTSEETVCLIKVFFKDFDKQVKVNELWFSPNPGLFPDLMFSPVDESRRNNTRNFLKKYVKNYKAMLNDPYYRGLATFNYPYNKLKPTQKILNLRFEDL